MSAVVTIEQVASEQRREVLLADYLAWVIFHKYERGDLTGYDIIRDRIAVEEMIVLV